MDEHKQAQQASSSSMFIRRKGMGIRDAVLLTGKVLHGDEDRYQIRQPDPCDPNPKSCGAIL